MTRILAFAATLTSVIVISACELAGPDGPNGAAPAAVAVSFDPCKDLSSESLGHGQFSGYLQPANGLTHGNNRFKGCRFKAKDYSLTVQVTDTPLASISKVYGTPFSPTLVGGRPAASADPRPKVDSCLLMVEMKGGGLFLDVTPYKPALDPCPILMDLAPKIVAMLPPGS